MSIGRLSVRPTVICDITSTSTDFFSFNKPVRYSYAPFMSLQYNLIAELDKTTLSGEEREGAAQRLTASQA